MACCGFVVADVVVVVVSVAAVVFVVVVPLSVVLGLAVVLGVAVAAPPRGNVGIGLMPKLQKKIKY